MGPTLGGFAVEKINFQWTTTIIALINCVFVLLLSVFFITRYCWCYVAPADGSSSMSSDQPSRKHRLPEI